MKTSYPLLFTAALTALAASPGLWAQNPSSPQASASGKPMASEADKDRYYAEMQERYRLMHEQMQKIRQTRDPQARQKLLQEHWQMVHGGMPGQAMGPGTMGGYGMGPGMAGGYGMGPGMMGYGMGPGMMGGYGMGMEGYGMGPGMMGYGMGPGAGGGGRAQDLPDLTPDQRTRLTRIQDDTRKKHWELMGQMMEEQAKLRDLYGAPTRDREAISKQRKKISELQRRMYETSADAHERMEDVFTPEQRDKSWRFWRNW